MSQEDVPQKLRLLTKRQMILERILKTANCEALKVSASARASCGHNGPILHRTRPHPLRQMSIAGQPAGDPTKPHTPSTEQRWLCKSGVALTTVLALWQGADWTNGLLCLGAARMPTGALTEMRLRVTKDEEAEGLQDRILSLQASRNELSHNIRAMQGEKTEVEKHIMQLREKVSSSC
jgi:hypothetical protein